MRTGIITTFLLLVCILPVVLSKYDNVNNIIVIVMENWSYDALFGTIEKANGLANAQKEPILQLDRNDKPFDVLPQVQPEVPKDLPNKPFDLGPYIGMYNETVDLTHAFYMEQMQINKGKMNKFVAYGSAKGLTVSYYDYKDRYLAQLAQNYTMFDAWHHSLFGGSFGNHQWLITPQTPVFPNAPPEIVNVLDKDGNLANPDEYEREVTPDGYAVNTIYSVSQPHPSWANVSHLLPLQNHTTIGCQLTEANISWKWYSGGYNDAMAGKADKSFQYHHQPFVYFENYEVGKPGRDHLQDYEDFMFDLKNNSLPQVSFYKPLGKYNMHPGYSIVGGEAEQKLEFVINAIKNSSYWSNTVVFITFDEHGGRWDHVAPPTVDRWGPGSRIPTVMVSPLVKKGFVDSTYRESTSIMKFIQDRYNLKSIGSRDAMQKPFDNVFIVDTSFPAWVIAIVVVCGVVFLLAVGIAIYQGIRYATKKGEAYGRV